MGVPLAPRCSAFSEPRGVGGAIFPGELVGFPSPSRRLWHPRGLGFWWGGGPRVHVGAGRGCPRGSRSRLPGISCRRWSRTAGNWVCLSLSRHLRPSWGPLAEKEGRGCWSQLCSGSWSSLFSPALVHGVSTADGEGPSRCAGRQFPADGGVCWGGQKAE